MPRRDSARRAALLVLALLAACRARERASETSGSPAARAGAPAAQAPVPAPERSGGSDAEAAPAAEGDGTLPEPEASGAPGPDPEGGLVLEIEGRPAFLALPAGEPPLPALLLVREAGRIGPTTRELARKLAAEGYAVLAPEVGAPRAGLEREELREAALLELAAARRFLAADPRVRATRFGAVGFGARGGIVLELALIEPSLRAIALVSTPLVTAPETLLPLRAEVLGLFGSRDAVVPSDRVADFVETLQATGKSHSVRMLDGAQGFADPRSQHFDAGAARVVWEELRAFLGRHLR